MAKRKPVQPALIEVVAAKLQAGDDPNTGLILAGWIDHCRTTRDVVLPPRVRGHYARLIKESLDGGVDTNVIKRALAAMLDNNVADRPHLLDSYIVKVQTGPERARPRPSTTDAAIANTLALGRRLQAEADAAKARQVGA